MRCSKSTICQCRANDTVLMFVQVLSDLDVEVKIYEIYFRVISAMEACGIELL